MSAAARLGIEALLALVAGIAVTLAILALHRSRAALLVSNRNLREEVDRQGKLEQSLRHSQAMTQGMFQTAVDAIITIDVHGIITSFNPAAEKLFGYGQEEVLGQNVKLLMPEPYKREHDEYISRHVRTGENRIIGKGREVVARRKDGSVFPIDLAVGEQRVGEEILFTGFIRDLSDRKKLEAEVLEVAEREQRRIGQDLHDGVGQDLTGVAFLAKALEGKLRAAHSPEAAEAERIADLTSRAVSQTRSLAHGLEPLDDQAGLLLALRDLCRSVHDVFHIECVLKADSPDEVQAQMNDLTTAKHLYRIAQEAVNNAVRHGRSRQIVVELTTHDHELVMRISDDGVGFGAAPGNGIGLRTMAFRARTIGAKLDIQSGVPRGVVVSCALEVK